MTDNESIYDKGKLKRKDSLNFLSYQVKRFYKKNDANAIPFEEAEEEKSSIRKWKSFLVKKKIDYFVGALFK